MSIDRGAAGRYVVVILLAGGAWTFGWFAEKTGDHEQHVAMVLQDLVTQDAARMLGDTATEPAYEIPSSLLEEPQIVSVLKRPIPKTEEGKANRIAVDQLLSANYASRMSDAQDYVLLGMSLFGFGFVILGTSAIGMNWKKPANPPPSVVEAKGQPPVRGGP